MNQEQNEIILLLRDYMNFLPPGPQEAFVPVGSGFTAESGWPLTAESIRRLNVDSLTGETYESLDQALTLLNRDHPDLYNALLIIYLREEAGHRDVDHIRTAAHRGSEEARDLLLQHDAAIKQLAKYLEGKDLYVRVPHKATGPKPGQNMQEMHQQLIANFRRYYEEDELPYRQALANAVTKMDGYYSRRHADRIIKGRMKAENEAS